MGITGRIKLVRVDAKIMSSYPVGGKREALKSLASLKDAGQAAADVAHGLLLLHEAVQAAGGDFRVTDLFRPPEVQIASRQRYDNWVAAGKPAPGSAKWDAKNMKNAYVAAPGYSFHEGGRAIDFDTAAMTFPNTPKDKLLDRMWELAIPLGWSPIIKAPTEGASESWHLDYLGEWTAFKARCGDYAEVAMCSRLDVGLGGYGNDEARALQAQLQRAGFDCGKVDGAIGARTEACLVAAGFSAKERDYTKLFSLPSEKPKSSVLA